MDDCIRCGERPAVDDLGYCGHCRWAVRAETEQGFRALWAYLEKWTRYEEWCSRHGLAA